MEKPTLKWLNCIGSKIDCSQFDSLGIETSGDGARF